MSPLARLERLNWNLVPHGLHAQLETWITDGEPPKSMFLQAVLINDLATAVRTASAAQRYRLVDLTSFLLYECPAECWGSIDRVKRWRELRGWRGMRNATEKLGRIYDH